MDSRTVRIIGASVGVILMATVMVLAVVWGYRSRPTEQPCAALVYVIEDRNERMYLTENELTAMLRAQDIYPVGRQMNRVSLHRIERCIAQHPMVRTAECYMTVTNEVKIRITQRIPLVRVQAPTDMYFIDTDRRVMPVRNAIRDEVLVVTGTIGAQTAAGVMADFANWLKKEAYWRERIHHLYVASPNLVYVYLRDGNGGVRPTRLVLGSMRGYERKLNKMRVFYLNIPQEIKDKNYTEYDLRFRGQVIGRY